MTKIVLMINWILIRISERRKRKEKEEKMNLINKLRNKQQQYDTDIKFTEILQNLKRKHNIEAIPCTAAWNNNKACWPCNQVIISSRRCSLVSPIASDDSLQILIPVNNNTNK